MRHFTLPLSLISMVVLAASCGENQGSGAAGSASASGSGGSSASSGGTASGGTASGGTASGGTASGGTGGSIDIPKPPVSPFIVVDQFGYLPTSEKIAVLRDPITGSDGGQSFTPGATIALVSSATGEKVFTGAATPWKGGAEDASSGDKAYWFDFSSVEAPGTYYVLDVEQDVRSFELRIADDVYRDVLKQAVRTFFYQRAGQEKKVEHAGAGFADGASHLGPLQDSHCRRYNAPNDAGTERDLRGGWYDAGDYNKYTSWTARYAIALLRAYAEAKGAFTDDYGIPESGNGVPDVVDEAKWGMDWLVRMQSQDGSVLSIVGVAHASPPSAASGPSVYGSASTSATLTSAAAFAYGSKIFRALGQTSYADDLESRAEKAWDWAAANPGVTFYNNDGGSGTQGLGAGQQETNDYGRLSRKVEAAAYLFEVTGDNKYRAFFDSSYASIHLIEWSFAYPFEGDEQQALLYYTKVPGATPGVVSAIKKAYGDAMKGDQNLKSVLDNVDPYLAYLKDYTWGSNATKSVQGSMFYDVITYGVDAPSEADAARGAARYIHYLHGVNPLQMVYLTNMSASGAESSANEFYHSWFVDKSPLWDRVGSSTYGPAPGFLTGGPNPSYDIDGCCPSGCGSAENNAACGAEPVSPPKGQPAQKSYKDFNTSWPLNSWAVTENSNGYQVAYIRLLSKLVK